MGNSTSNWIGGASGLLGSVVTSITGAVTGKKAQKRAHKYEQENMALQDQYQRAMVTDSPSLLKQGLQNAGYSTADPEGTGTTAPNVSMPGTSATLGYPNIPDFGQAIVQGISGLAQARNINSQTRINEIEEAYRARLLEGQIGEYNAKIQQIQDTLPLTVANIEADTAQKVASKTLTENQAKQVVEDTKRIVELTKGVSIDNEFKPDLNEREVKKLDKEIFLLAKEGKIKEVHAKLASMGILVGADNLTQLAAIVAQGKTPEIMDALASCVDQTLGKLPDLIGKLFTSLFDGLVDGVSSGVKGVFGFRGHAKTKIKDAVDSTVDAVSH